MNLTEYSKQLSEKAAVEHGLVEPGYRRDAFIMGYTAALNLFLAKVLADMIKVMNETGISPQ